MSSPLDTAPLTDPVDRAEVRAFTADLRRRGVLRTRTLPFLLLGIGAVVFVFAFGSVFISLVSTLVDGGAGSALLLIPVLGVARCWRGDCSAHSAPPGSAVTAWTASPARTG